MRFLLLLAVLAAILTPGVASATPSGPFPTISVLGRGCESAFALTAGDQLRVTFQKVVQTCAGQQCSVLQNDPMDATSIEVRHDEVLLTGAFKPTVEKCGLRPVWVYSLPVPASGKLMFSAHRAGTVYLTIEAKVKGGTISHANDCEASSACDESNGERPAEGPSAPSPAHRVLPTTRGME